MKSSIDHNSLQLDFFIKKCKICKYIQNLFCNLKKNCKTCSNCDDYMWFL